MTTYEEPEPAQEVTMLLSVYEEKLNEARLQGYDEGFDAALEQIDEDIDEARSAQLEEEIDPCDPTCVEFEVIDEDQDER